MRKQIHVSDESKASVEEVAEFFNLTTAEIYDMAFDAGLELLVDIMKRELKVWEDLK